MFSALSQSLARFLTPWLLSTVQGVFRLSRPVVGALTSLWFLQTSRSGNGDGDGGLATGGGPGGSASPSRRGGKRGHKDVREQFAVGTASPAGLLRSAQGAASLLLALQKRVAEAEAAKVGAANGGVVKSPLPLAAGATSFAAAASSPNGHLSGTRSKVVALDTSSSNLLSSTNASSSTSSTAALSSSLLSSTTQRLETRASWFGGLLRRRRNEQNEEVQPTNSATATSKQ